MEGEEDRTVLTAGPGATARKRLALPIGMHAHRNSDYLRLKWLVRAAYQRPRLPGWLLTEADYTR